jgi:hypothetical protein
MNRFLLLLLIAGLAFLVILFAQKPEIIENIWLWIIGLIGAIVKAFQLLAQYFKKLITRNADETKEAKEEEVAETASDKFSGSTLKLMRISGDGDSTIGNLFINDAFFCYTLEDTYQEVKIPGKTRIPKGNYNVGFRKELTPLTQKYRDANPDWFTYHLEVENVPGFNSIYIHSGGTHADTEGCILVSDSLQVKDKENFLTNSRNTFKRFYQYLSQQINMGIPVRLLVKDEEWIKTLNSKL